MAGHVTILGSGETLDAKQHFEGAWREFSRLTLADGSIRHFAADDAEYAIFVMSGEGVARIGARSVELTPGSAITVAWRAVVDIEAKGSEIELFVTTLDVDGAAA